MSELTYAQPIRQELDHPYLMQQARNLCPEAFDGQGRLLSPVLRQWITPAGWFRASTPIDGRHLAELPRLDPDQASAAIETTAAAFPSWSSRTQAARSEAVGQAAALIQQHRELLLRLLAWDIGKTLPTAANDVDRCLSGIVWYLDHLGPMIHGRHALGLVSNIASWNYPFSVLLLNVLVQALVGNVVVAKIPTQGGGISLTLAFALLQRAGLPVSLVGGRGAELTEALVSHGKVAGIAFVGGRTNGAAVAERLGRDGKRYALEMEGVNAYAITRFSDWAGLARQIRAGFDYGKQRCTAYTRWVVQRALVDDFIDTYADAVGSLRVGHPLIDRPVDFGPLISSGKVAQLHSLVGYAQATGARVLHRGVLHEEDFIPGQDRDAYLAPMLLQGVQAPNELYLREPFGPVDLLVPVDDDEQLVAEANVSGGALVGSIATDDPVQGEQLARRLLAYKVGVNRLRSRGDREESFGGLGRSWQGAFVGGSLLVQAFTHGDQRPAGNWPD